MFSLTVKRVCVCMSYVCGCVYVCGGVGVCVYVYMCVYPMGAGTGRVWGVATPPGKIMGKGGLIPKTPPAI